MVCTFRSRSDLAEQIFGERRVAVEIVLVQNFTDGPPRMPGDSGNLCLGRAQDEGTRDERASKVVERNASDAEPLARLAPR